MTSLLLIVFTLGALAGYLLYANRISCCSKPAKTLSKRKTYSTYD